MYYDPLIGRITFTEIKKKLHFSQNGQAIRHILPR